MAFWNVVTPSKLPNLRVGLETPAPHPQCSMRRYGGLFLLRALSPALPWWRQLLGGPFTRRCLFEQAQFGGAGRVKVLLDPMAPPHPCVETTL